MKKRVLIIATHRNEYLDTNTNTFSTNIERATKYPYTEDGKKQALARINKSNEQFLKIETFYTNG